jgi:integration host factor subunit alpha
MTPRTVTRADLCQTAYKKAGLSHKEVAGLVQLVLREITDCLCRGEKVKLSSFGSFIVRKKNRRIGRNPKTGEEVTIPSHRVVLFKSSDIFKKSINSNPHCESPPPSLL